MSWRAQTIVLVLLASCGPTPAGSCATRRETV